MTIKEILESPKAVIKQHIHQLADDYKRLTNYRHNPCLSCSDEVNNMLIFLKQSYMATQFEFKLPKVIYKIKQGDGRTISNDKMTDELAIDFLKTKPSRIELFSKYPEDWKLLIGLEDEPTEPTTEPKPKGCSSCKDKKVASSKTATKRSGKTTSSKKTD